MYLVIYNKDPKFEPIIVHDDETHMDSDDPDLPMFLYRYYYNDDSFSSHKRNFVRRPEIENILMKNPRVIVLYAKNIIKGRWHEAEEIIKKSNEWIFQYAFEVIQGRWPEAEHLITDPRVAYDYANNVVHGRWPEGEQCIAKDPELFMQYAHIWDVEFEIRPIPPDQNKKKIDPKCPKIKAEYNKEDVDSSNIPF